MKLVAQFCAGEHHGIGLAGQEICSCVERFVSHCCSKWFF